MKLNSATQQLAKCESFNINKEIGLLKRQGTNERKRTDLEKMKEKNQKLEEEFQEKRAKRIAEAMADIKAKNPKPNSDQN